MDTLHAHNSLTHTRGRSHTPKAPEGRHYALKIIFNFGVETNEMRNAYANEYLVRMGH